MRDVGDRVGFCLERAFRSFEALRLSNSTDPEALSSAVTDLRPLVALVLRDLARDQGRPFHRDAEELIQNIEGWLVELLPGMTADLGTPRQYRAYLSVAISRRLRVEAGRLRHARGAPPAFREPDPPKSELAELEERLYVEDVLAAAENRVVEGLGRVQDDALSKGMSYAARCYLRGIEPSALHLQFQLGIKDPRTCLEKARVRLRMELAEIWRRDLAGIRTSDGPIAKLFGGSGRRFPARRRSTRAG